MNALYERLAEAFGDQTAVIAYVAILIAAVLIVFWIVRGIWRALRGGVFVAGGNARKHRLAVLDATPIDNRRRLVLVRRDDVEHLILIGGMNDLVIESTIGKNIPMPTEQSASRKHDSSGRTHIAPSTVAKTALGVGATVAAVELQKARAQHLPDKQIEPATAAPELQRTQTLAEVSVNAPTNQNLKENTGQVETPDVELYDTPKAAEPNVPNRRSEDLAEPIRADLAPQNVPVQNSPEELAPQDLAPEVQPAKEAAFDLSEDTLDSEMDDLLNQLTGTAKR